MTRRGTSFIIGVVVGFSIGSTLYALSGADIVVTAFAVITSSLVERAFKGKRLTIGMHAVLLTFAAIMIGLGWYVHTHRK